MIRLRIRQLCMTFLVLVGKAIILVVDMGNHSVAEVDGAQTMVTTHKIIDLHNDPCRQA